MSMERTHIHSSKQGGLLYSPKTYYKQFHLFTMVAAFDSVFKLVFRTRAWPMVTWQYYQSSNSQYSILVHPNQGKSIPSNLATITIIITVTTILAMVIVTSAISLHCFMERHPWV